MTSPALRVILTARDTSDRLTEKAPLSLTPKEDLPGTHLFIDPAKRFQTMEELRVALEKFKVG